MRILTAALAAGLALGATACSTTVSIRSLQPGSVSLGSLRHIELLQTEGRRSAQEIVVGEILGQTRSRGYFTARDRTEQGWEVQVIGRKANLRNADGQRVRLAEGRAGVRVDVLEWNAWRDVKEVRTKDSEGNTRTSTEATVVGNVVLAVSLFDRSGRALLAEREYEGHASGAAGKISRSAMIEAAARRAIGSFLGDVTPREVQTTVRLDDDDDGQKYILEMAKAGNTAQAASEARRYLRANPDNAAAAYNLAVLLDAMGEYHEALDTYDRALRLGHKDFYGPARAGCARRLAAAEELADGHDATAPSEPAARGAYPASRAF